MIHGYHVIFGAYGFWLPNDPRGSWSDFVGAWEMARFGRSTRGPERQELTPQQERQRQEAKRALKYPAPAVSHQNELVVARRTLYKSPADLVITRYEFDTGTKLNQTTVNLKRSYSRSRGAISANGDFVAMADKNEIKVVKRDGTVITLAANPLGSGHDVCGMKFSPNCEILVAWTFSGEFQSWSTRTWMRDGQPFRLSSMFDEVEISRDGSLLAVGHRNGKVSLVDRRRGHSTLPILKNGMSSRAVRFSPCGRTIASLNRGGSGKPNRLVIRRLPRADRRPVTELFNETQRLTGRTLPGSSDP